MSARLYITQSLTGGAAIALDEKQTHYLIHVLRQKTGDTIQVFNGHDGVWLAEITLLHKKNITVTLHRALRIQQSVPDIWLLAAPLRGGKTEFVVEKATELGISRFIPVLTEFTVARRINEERLTTIAIEAAEQCERMDIPVIDSLTSFTDMLGNWDKNRMILHCDESGSGQNAKTLPSALPATKYAVLIGPEGGFSEKERDLLRHAGFAAGMCMGPRILRADTAAIAALTLTQAWLGDWDKKPDFS